MSDPDQEAMVLPVSDPKTKILQTNFNFAKALLFKKKPLRKLNKFTKTLNIIKQMFSDFLQHFDDNSRIRN